MDAKEREKESEGDGERALVTKTGCKEKYERKEDEMFSPTGGGLTPREASPWSLLLTDRETPFIPTPMTWRKRQCTLRQGKVL
ncbi:hypothetical protein PUN28_013615 [Cardiocondyla obscurior]|uniref:Uncharacterized protein n=1 Tax=Cardiocondyla obscurior TaxID=286306 RepID=A0AAW2F261_9HYME